MSTRAEREQVRRALAELLARVSDYGETARVGTQWRPDDTVEHMRETIAAEGAAYSAVLAALFSVGEAVGVRAGEVHDAIVELRVATEQAEQAES